METDNRGSPGSQSQSEPADAPPHYARRLNWSLILSLVALLVLGAAGYFYSDFYSDRDAGKEIASAPRSEQAASPKDADAAAPRPAENAVPEPASRQQTAAPAPSDVPRPDAPAPSATPTPNPPGTLAPPPGSQPPAAQAPTSSAPIESAVRPSPAPPASLRDQPASLPKDEVVFVRRSSANIRSEPSRRGRVIGSAARGTRFKVVGRSGGWVQVEGDAGTGWIGERLLGPDAR